MPPPPPEWLRRGLHKHQWAYQLSLVGGPPPGQKQQPEWFPWWKIYTCCMHVDMHKFMCVCVYVCVCMYICMYVCVCVCVWGKQYIVVGLKNQSAYTYLKTSTLFPDSAYSPSLSTNVSQLFLTRGAICNQFQISVYLGQYFQLLLSPAGSCIAIRPLTWLTILILPVEKAGESVCRPLLHSSPSDCTRPFGAFLLKSRKLGKYCRKEVTSRPQCTVTIRRKL